MVISRRITPILFALARRSSMAVVPSEASSTSKPSLAQRLHDSLPQWDLHLPQPIRRMPERLTCRNPSLEDRVAVCIYSWFRHKATKPERWWPAYRRARNMDRPPQAPHDLREPPPAPGRAPSISWRRRGRTPGPAFPATSRCPCPKPPEVGNRPQPNLSRWSSPCLPSRTSWSPGLTAMSISYRLGRVGQLSGSAQCAEVARNRPGPPAGPWEAEISFPAPRVSIRRL